MIEGQTPSTKARSALVDRLKEEGRYDLSAKLEKCGVEAWLDCVCQQSTMPIRTRCKNKWCPACAVGLAAEKSERLAEVVKTFQWPLFTTWTMKNVDDLGVDHIRHLWRSFGRLRRMACFRLVKAGIVTCEITNIGNGWHPHLHAVLDAEWLGPARLKPLRWESAESKRESFRLSKIAMENTWSKALRQPCAVMHAKRCNAQTITKEVVKYTVKGSELVESEEPVGPLIDVLTKCRMLKTFGYAHGFKFTKKEREKAWCEYCEGPGQWLPPGVIPQCRLQH